jgi:single-stranded-DNA-specific exonuclease
MQPLKKRWRTAKKITPEANQALGEYPPILRQILYNRGYPTQELASQYLEARQPPGTDPFEMNGMQEAVDRIQYAIQHKEPVAVYGDYDADGVTATALLMEVLQALGAEVQGYIPNRFDEGYGLNSDALDNLREEGVRLVITVDCGIRSPIEAQHAREIGMDLIISDHHHPDKNLPQALAVINPKQNGDLYPEKDLAGVGLAYKLAAALISKTSMGNGQFIPSAEDYLDLVALGTVADLAPLVGENRALVRRGLERIRRPRRQGVMALIGVSGLLSERITASDIGFALGPRLNAAGRLESALNALTLLTTTDVHEAAKLAQQLEIQNRERQQITRDIQAQAELMALADNPDALLLFAAHPDFNPGVVGLAASRLTDLYYRPAIVAQHGEEFTRGSCRSIAEFHITQALDQCSDLLEHHGGHAAAAGFTVRNEKLPELIERLQSIAVEQLSALDLRPTLNADLELPLSDLRPEILEYLDWLQPTGYGNHQAYFISRDLKVVKSQTVGRDNSHLKLTVTDGWITYNSIAFRQGYWQEQMPAKIDVMYNFELNEYNGRKFLQLNVRDIKIAGED